MPREDGMERMGMDPWRHECLRWEVWSTPDAVCKGAQRCHTPSPNGTFQSGWSYRYPSVLQNRFHRENQPRSGESFRLGSEGLAWGRPLSWTGRNTEKDNRTFHSVRKGVKGNHLLERRETEAIYAVLMLYI
ncbi:hypothetical protein MG293_005703 [Ovis ammon polii]|uniref:Uncharacterized protein n=1 Tax=Ovis ammon polii TaxID=230172 RepID=A0AAD4UIU3_OVIAM|nr:hypothetical protein MG293_005703 [Ovis ammon polii]